MPTHTFDYDLIVIGSGAGGSVAASVAARSGLRVALIEEKTLGGDAANWGDVPMKALLDTAHLYHTAKLGSRFGLRTTTLGYNYPSIRAWKEKAVKGTGVGGDDDFYRDQGVSVFHGKAHFLTPHEITVNRRHLSANYFLIATGSSWVAPKIQGLAGIDYHTPRTIIEALRPPKSLLVIGGGRYGVEVAELMATFGTKVYILEKDGHLLPEFDSSVGTHIAESFASRYGVQTLTDATPLAITKEGFTHRVLFSRGGAQKHLKVDEIVVATDYQPNLDLGLENASVAYTAKGVTVDRHLRTSTKHIYAAGDVIGAKRDTQASLLESQVAAQNIVAGNRVTPDYSVMPSVVFTRPEIAEVGLANAHYKNHHQVQVPLSIIARSNIADETDGFVKLVADAQGVIVGGVIVGPHASELIHEISLAVRHKLTATQLATTPHAFLSWAEAIRVAAQKLSITIKK